MLLLGHPGLGAQNADIYSMKRAECWKTHAPARHCPCRRLPAFWDLKIIKIWTLFWNPLFCLSEPKKRSLAPLLGGPKRISRQVSAILGAKKLPKRSPGGSKIGSKIESGLKMAQSQKMQYLSHENLIFKGPGSPKSDPKPVQNWFQIASSTRRPSESLWRASWNALGGLRSRKKEVGNGSWAAWAPKGCQNWGPKSDPKTLQDAFRSPRGAKRLPGSNF